MPVATLAPCPCGSPASHIELDEDSAGWACRVPNFHPGTGLRLEVVCTDTSGRQHRRCQSTDSAGVVQCMCPAGHTEPAGEPAHLGRNTSGRLVIW